MEEYLKPIAPSLEKWVDEFRHKIDRELILSWYTATPKEKWKFMKRLHSKYWQDQFAKAKGEV